eukprot:scaffold48_cov311-Pinguiococcus_pyrenoidosus.AAC.89
MAHHARDQISAWTEATQATTALEAPGQGAQHKRRALLGNHGQPSGLPQREDGRQGRRRGRTPPRPERGARIGLPGSLNNLCLSSGLKRGKRRKDTRASRWWSAREEAKSLGTFQAQKAGKPEDTGQTDTPSFQSF